MAYGDDVVIILHLVQNFLVYLLMRH